MKTTNNFVFFWGKDDVFSNFYFSPFRHQGKTFKWSEQAIMYRKAKLFGANHIAQQIMMAQTPLDCKRLGRSKQIPFDEELWEEHREAIYYSVLIDKFSVGRLRKELIDTGVKHLAEASPFDKIWGIGMDENHKDVEDPRKWKGLNLLGEVLMEVRKNIWHETEFEGEK